MRTPIPAGLAALALLSGAVVKAQDDEAIQQHTKLDQAKHAINSMRETYAGVVRKEEEAKAEHDPVRLNCVHQNTARIAGLVTVADHTLDDMRVAVSTRQPSEAVDGELEKILLAKTKVESVKKDADRCVGIKMVGTDNGEGETLRDFSNSSSVADDPLGSLNNALALPEIASHPPPASPIGSE